MYQTAFESNYTALTEDGADWVVAAGIKFVGIDYMSIATYEQLAPAHQSLMRAVRPPPVLHIMHFIQYHLMHFILCHILHFSQYHILHSIQHFISMTS